MNYIVGVLMFVLFFVALSVGSLFFANHTMREKYGVSMVDMVKKIEKKQDGQPIQKASPQDLMKTENILGMSLQLLQERSKAGEPDAMYGLGIMYLEGGLVHKDLTKGYDLINQAAEKSYAPAEYLVAMTVFSDEGSSEEERYRALNFLRNAASQHHPESEALLNKIQAGTGL